MSGIDKVSNIPAVEEPGDIPLMLLLDSLPVCISYVDSLQVYRYNNQTYEVWFRRPRETVNGRHMQDILGPEAFERIKPKVETALSGREVHFEMRIPYKDAGMRDVEASYVPHIAEDGLVLGFFALIRDVSERKQAEQAIYRQSLFFNNAHDAVSTCDLSGNIQSWNARAKELYGYSAEETVGKHIGVIHAPEERDWLPRRVLERVQRQGSFHTIGRRVTRDGKTLTVDSHLTLLKDDAGEPTGVLCMCNDITEELGLKAQLLTAVEDEQQRLGYDLHDLLGSQLTGMAILANVWAQEVGAGKRTITRKELENLAVMIQETVTQARGIARGLAAGRVEEFGLRDALSRYLRDAQSFSQITCKLVFPVTLASIGRIPETAHHIYYIVREAVNNVVKHSRASYVEVRFRGRDGHVELTITDDGVGPKKAMRGYRDGMGVHTMRHRASLIGATLEIAPGPEQGTVVRCIIPKPEPPVRAENGA